VKCIKDKNQNVLVNEEAIKERWKEYFTKLFNDGGDTRIKLGCPVGNKPTINKAKTYIWAVLR